MSCQFDEDAYKDEQLNKHLADMELAEIVSNCCGAPIIENTDICSQCGEHCSEQELGEYMYDVQQAAEEDAADAQRELKREQDNG